MCFVSMEPISICDDTSSRATSIHVPTRYISLAVTAVHLSSDDGLSLTVKKAPARSDSISVVCVDLVATMPDGTLL